MLHFALGVNSEWLPFYWVVHDLRFCRKEPLKLEAVPAQVPKPVQNQVQHDPTPVPVPIQNVAPFQVDLMICHCSRLS